MPEQHARSKSDWVSERWSFIIAWGLPVVTLVIATLLPPLARTSIWIVVLSWMGVACLANARRCNRTHCHFTGPFFLIMVVPVALHGFEVLSLGRHGWEWLALAIGVGNGALWLSTEVAWGKYFSSTGGR